MKKIIVFSLFIVLAATQVIAQTKAKPKSSQELDPFSLIVTLGSNYSIFTNPQTAGSTFTQAKQLNGWSIGISGNWPLAKSFDLQVGAKLTQKGSAVNADTPYYHIFSRTRPMYIELPVMIEYTYKLDRNFKLFADAGVYAAMGVGGKTSYSGTSGPLGTEGSISGNDKILWGNPGSGYVQPKTYVNMNKFDFGLIGQVGIQYWKIRLALGYEHGLSNVGYTGSADVPDPNAKNKTIALTLGVKF